MAKATKIKIAIATRKVGIKKFESYVVTKIAAGKKETDSKVKFPTLQGASRRESKLKLKEFLSDYSDSFTLVKQSALK